MGNVDFPARIQMSYTSCFPLSGSVQANEDCLSMGVIIGGNVKPNGKFLRAIVGNKNSIN